MEIPMDLTCWYFNHRRVLELIGSTNQYTNIYDPNDPLLKMRVLVTQQNALLEWLKQSDTQPLDKLLLQQNLTEGTLFTHHTNYFFKGISSVRKALDKGRKITPASGYAKLDHWSLGVKLRFVFHHDHLTSCSAWDQLAGQKRMFMLGAIQKINETEIIAIPYVIGNFILNTSGKDRMHAYLWIGYNELHIDNIYNFSEVNGYNPIRTKESLNVLHEIPEKDIKTAFAEIINEPHIPKDWGGECSDLFSSHVLYNGRRITAAFVFKGPAKFKPMTLAELGKNGDQISRLYDEPADLLILQHCHEITLSVRKTMRAFAQQAGNPRLCCIIDGYDTLRLLQCYNKCNLSKII